MYTPDERETKIPNRFTHTYLLRGKIDGVRQAINHTKVLSTKLQIKFYNNEIKEKLSNESSYLQVSY